MLQWHCSAMCLRLFVNVGSCMCLRGDFVCLFVLVSLLVSDGGGVPICPSVVFMGVCVCF